MGRALWRLRNAIPVWRPNLDAIDASSRGRAVPCKSRPRIFVERTSMPFERGTFKRGAMIGVMAFGLIGPAACGGRTANSLNTGHGRGGPPAAAIGVNGYLWRATLDTLAFMPLASADPYGGVVIT